MKAAQAHLVGSQPAEHSVRNKSVVSGNYSYWRFRMMYSMMAGYAAFYFMRSNFSAAIPFLESEMGYTKTKIGLIITTAAMAYGFGKGISGLLSDRCNARYFMTAGLLLSAVVNLCMGFSEVWWLFLVLWTLNSCFQSMGWPPCARLLTHWFSPKEIGTKWAIWNASQQIGAGTILALSPFIISYFNWRYVFFIPAIFCIGFSFFLFNRLRDTPQSLGFPPIEEHHGLVASGANLDEENLSMREIIFGRILNNKLVWYVCCANFFLYFVRMSMFNWAPTFLQEFKGSTLLAAGCQTAAFDVTGIFGGILAGYLSDKMFSGYRGRVGAIFMFLLAFCVVFLWKSPASSTVMHTLGMLTIGFLVSGPQILVGVAATDFASKKAAGAASGLTGTVGYIGAAATGGIGYVVDTWGWDRAFFLIATSALLGALFFALTWNHRAKVLEEQT